MGATWLGRVEDAAEGGSPPGPLSQLLCQDHAPDRQPAGGSGGSLCIKSPPGLESHRTLLTLHQPRVLPSCVSSSGSLLQRDNAAGTAVVGPGETCSRNELVLPRLPQHPRDTKEVGFGALDLTPPQRWNSLAWPGLAWQTDALWKQLWLDLCVLATLWVPLPDASENRSQQHLRRASGSEQAGLCCRNLWKEANTWRPWTTWKLD